MRQGNVVADSSEPRRGKFQSLRTKFIVYFCLVFVFVLVAVDLVTLMGLPFAPYGGRLEQQKAEAFRSLNLIADLKKDRLLRIIKRRRDNVHLLFDNDMVRYNVALLQAAISEATASGRKDPELWALVRKEDSFKNFVIYLDKVRTMHGGYKSIYIADVGTGTVFASTDSADLGTDVHQQPYFTGALASKKDHVYVDNVDLGHRSHSPIFHISRIINDKDGEAVAVLVTALNVDETAKPILYTGEGLGQRGEALLVNHDLRILTTLKHPFADGTRAKPLEYRINARPAMLAARGEEGIIDSEDYRGEPVLAAYRFIPVTPEWGWGMVIKRDKGEIFAPLHREITYSILISLAGILTVVGLSIVVARSLSNPILSLSRTAYKVAEGDLEARASVTTSDEVGHLGVTFNLMIERLEEWHKELEEQVNARTAELKKTNVELGREIIERKRAEEHIRQLSQQLMQAQEIAHQRLAYDLHDHLAQDLSTLKISLDTLFDDEPDSPDAMRQRVFKVSKKLQHSIKTVRDLTYDLHPASLDKIGLVRTVRQCCEEFAARTALKIDFFSVGMDNITLDFDTKITLYRLIQEGLTNIRKHADASQVTIRLSSSFSHTMLHIEDNGKGFDIEKRLAAALHERRMGLQSMAQRVAFLNGEMKIESRPMQGTKIRVKVPYMEKANG